VLPWGLATFAREATTDDFRRLEDRLLRFETFDAAVGIRTLEDAATQELSACDSHAQRALLLLEIPLAEKALRTGAVRDFDQHIQSIKGRATQVLACTPRDSLGWLVLFGLQVEQGQLGDRSFDLLDASYDSSPYEAWIGVRRLAVALPVVAQAPDPIRRKILSEFGELIKSRFLDIPARAYSTVRGPARDLLQSVIDGLDPSSQKAFSQALRQVRP